MLARAVPSPSPWNSNSRGICAAAEKDIPQALVYIDDGAIRSTVAVIVSEGQHVTFPHALPVPTPGNSDHTWIDPAAREGVPITGNRIDNEPIRSAIAIEVGCWSPNL